MIYPKSTYNIYPAVIGICIATLYCHFNNANTVGNNEERINVTNTRNMNIDIL